MRWDVAHRVASIAAVQAHCDLAVDRDRYVDVFAAIAAAGVECMAQPMPRLFGWYVAPQDGGPEILVNAGLDEAGLRHTAAHELGHHALEHGTQIDLEDPFVQWGRGGWPDHEKTAEAFAAWFLMPLPAVREALRFTGTAHPRGPDDVYQLARWLGTSYAGAVRHLVNLRLARPEQAKAWAQVKSAALRRRAQARAGDPPGHVWVLGPAACGGTAHVAAGDRIRLVGCASGAEASIPPGVIQVRDVSINGAGTLFADEQLGTPRDLLLQVTGELISSCSLAVASTGGQELWNVTLVPVPQRQGTAEAWADSPIQQLGRPAAGQRGWD